MRKLFDRYLWRSYRQLSKVSFWINRRFTATGKLILITLFISGLIGIDIQRVQSYQLFSFALMIILVAIISSYRKKVQFTIQRQLPKYACVDEVMEYKITLHNDGIRAVNDFSILDSPIDPRPTIDTFINTTEPRSVTKSRFDRFFRFPRWQWLKNKNTNIRTYVTDVKQLPKNTSINISITLLPIRRGITQLMAVEILLPDVMGVYRAITKISCFQTLIVLPRRYSVPVLRLSGKRQHNPGGVNNAGSVGDAQEFTSLREYLPGDSIRKIHWNSWAKTGHPVVRQYQEEYFSRYGLILDTFCDNDQLEVFEEAVSLAASYVYLLNNQDSFIDLMFVSNKAYHLSSGRGVTTGFTKSENLLEELALISTTDSKTFESLSAIIRENITTLSSALIIFIDWDSNRQKLLRMLQANNIPYQAFLICSEQNINIDIELSLYNVNVLSVGNIESGLAAL